MKKRFCDRCGKELHSDTRYTHMELKQFVGDYEQIFRDEVDLCLDCHEKFKIFINVRKMNDISNPLGDPFLAIRCKNKDYNREKELMEDMGS